MGAFDPDAFLAKIAPFDPDAFLAKVSKEAPSPYSNAVPQVNAQGQVIRQPDAVPTSRLDAFGRSMAGLADTTLGGLAPGIIAPITYAGSRAFGASPAQATASSQAAAAPFEQPFGRTFGVAQTPEYRGEASQRLAAGVGEGVQRGSQFISEKTDIPQADVENMLGTLLMAAPVGIKKGYQAAAPLVKQGIEAIPAVQAAREAKIAKSYERGVDIDATKLANQYKINLNPAEKNPTFGNRVGAALVGNEDLNNRLSINNQNRWVEISQDALGLTRETPLNSPDVFNKARAQPKFSEPYNKIQAVTNIEIPQDTFGKLDNAKSSKTFNDPNDAALVSAYIDNLKDELAQGGSGSKLLKSVQDLRQQAQSVFNSEKAGGQLDQGAKARATAQMAAADVLDDIIYHNLPDAASKKAFLPARAALADSYAIESATNFGTGLVDPNVFAKMINDGKYMTGVAGDMGRIAANNPNAARINAKYAPTTTQQFKRNTPLGLLGAAIGGVSGMGFEGAIGGAAIGGGVNEILRRAYANRMTSPDFQKANIVPPDYRNRLNPPMFNEPQVNMLRPVEPGQSNIVPFDPRNALLDPEIRPNFVFGKAEPLVDRADINPSSPFFSQRQIGNDTPADVLARRRAEDARQKRMAQMAEADALAAEKQNFVRTPTRGEVILDVDPITGKLLPQTSQGIKGATLETFQDYTSTLRSAIDKMSSRSTTFEPIDIQKVKTGKVYQTTTEDHIKGQPIYAYKRTSLTPVVEKGNRAFDLTAAEKVAFDKTKFYIAEVSPGFEKLNDKAIVSRMMDRKWVEDAAATARQKSIDLEQVAIRSRTPEMMDARASAAQNAELARRAEEASLQMKSTLDLLEDRLVKLRADASGKRQGPKTQGAIRNNLTANQNRNKLRED
jgi:hypothetical protein